MVSQREEAYKAQLRRTKSAVESAVVFEARHFKATYLGHTPVTETAGHEVVKEAMAKIRRAKLQQIKVFVRVTGEFVQVMHRKSQEILQNALLQEITFVSLHPGQKNHLSLITSNSQNIRLCHGFKVKKRSKELQTAIGEAFIAKDEAFKRSGGRADSDSEALKFTRALTSSALNEAGDPSAPLGLFEARHLGSIPVADARGHEAVMEAIELLAQMKDINPVGVALVVSGEGLKVVETLTSEVISNTFIKNLRLVR